MAEISGPRIESISDPGSGSQEPPREKPQVKPYAAWKPDPSKTPEIGAPEEEEKRQLDEMA
jgi:hypothetical protein